MQRDRKGKERGGESRMPESMGEPGKKEREAEPRQRREGKKGRGEERGQLVTPGKHRYWGSPGRHGLISQRFWDVALRDLHWKWCPRAQWPSLSYPLPKGESFWLYSSSTGGALFTRSTTLPPSLPRRCPLLFLLLPPLPLQ